MTANAAWLKIDPDRLVAAFEQEAVEQLNRAEGEVVLDLSAIRRIDPAALKALEKLAGKAEERSVKVVLHGVNIDLYLVLKLVKLAPRFGFDS